MDAPEGVRWELVVVDNGSSDGTREAALIFSDRLPIRVVREETPGLSHARNRGAAEARGRYICWTDDDVILDRNWLVAYAAAFERHPEAAVFGGRITPVLQSPSPSWFLRFADRWPLTTLMANRNFGAKSVPLDITTGIIPWGANYAVRSAEQRQVRYDPSLGVAPHQRRLGEEAEAIYQILKPGAYGWWVPDAVVQHVIPCHRQTLRYVFDYFAAYGETIAHLEGARPGAHHLSSNESELRKLRGRPLVFRALGTVHALMFGITWLLGATRRSLHFLMRAGFYAGVAAEAQRRPRGCP
jgi:glycosyltransferase involved in cell wall biosynthesis